MREPKSQRRGSVSPVIQLLVDPGAATPLHRQVYEGLREAILSGRLARGARLPSSRALATDLGVARNTVLQAFDQLRSEGYLHGRRGGGTRAREVIPDSLLTVRATARRTSTSPVAQRSSPAAPRISQRGRTLVTSGAALIRAEGPHVPFEL